MFDVFLDSLLDTLKVIPFLLIAFFIIELLEHKLKSNEKLVKTGKIGPLIGSILGIIPQCGVASLATNLYVTRIISLGTLISVYLTTSDEALPILLSENAPLDLVLKTLAVKFVIGIIFGFIIDFIYCKRNNEDNNFSLCDDEHCHCEKSLILPVLKHTFSISFFILVVNFVLNCVFEYGFENYLENLLISNSIFSSFITAVIGLIPNCAASVIITKIYLVGSIEFGAFISGLLVNSGIGLIILFKTNKNLKENMVILLNLYLIGVLSGIVISLMNIF